MGISTAVDTTAVARTVGLKSSFNATRGGRFTSLPQRIAVVGQGSTGVTYSSLKRQYTSALEVAQAFGFGSPLHIAALQLMPINGDGVGSVPVTFYPLQADTAGVAATSSITPSGTQSTAGAYRVSVGGIKSGAFTIPAGATVAQACSAITLAINSTLNIPVVAVNNSTAVALTMKWKGTSGNGVLVDVEAESSGGMLFITPLTSGGLVNPSVQPALDQVGGVWETMFINCLGTTDSTALSAYSTFGEGRWGALTRKPAVVVSGLSEGDVSAAASITSGRKTDRTNVVVNVPGSRSMPMDIAARAVARMAVRANNNPPHDYGSLPLDGLAPGLDSQGWDYAKRDAAVKAGISTTVVRDGVVVLGDVVTMYHPDGDPLPAYRFVVDIIKLQNVVYNVDLEFEGPAWDGAPLIPDAQPTVNPTAKKPRTAKAAAAAIIDALSLEAILSDPEASKAGILAEIDGQNPKRLNLMIPVKLSGNTNIISIDLVWSFYFGTPALID